MFTLKKQKGIIPKGPSIFYFIKRKKEMGNPKKILDVFLDIINHHGQVCSFKSGLRERTYLIADANLAHKIFTTPKAFPKYPNLVPDVTKLQSLIGKGLLATHSDEEWQEHRKQMVGSFKPSIVLTHYWVIINKHLDLLLNDHLSRKNDHLANFSEIGILFSGRIISELLSPHHNLSDNELIEAKRILDKAILEFHNSSFKKNAPAYKKAMLAIAKRLFDSYIDHKDISQNSLIAKMSSSFPNIESCAQEQNALLERILNIIIAGYETTATTISWIFYLLAKHPHFTDNLYQQIAHIDLNDPSSYEQLENCSLLSNVIKEGMRLYPALWFNIRYCAEDIILDEIRIRKNDRIMLLPYLSNLDSGVYGNPNLFDPLRYDKQETPSTFPFGHGPRLCVGKALAEMEIKMIIAGFIQKFRLTPFSHPAPIGGVLLHPDVDIQVKLINRLKVEK